MTLRQRLLDRAETYVLGGLVVLATAGFYAIMDQRHEPTGAVTRSELSNVRLRISTIESYQRLAPSEQYNAARAEELAQLRRRETELLEELQQTSGY